MTENDGCRCPCHHHGDDHEHAHHHHHHHGEGHHHREDERRGPPDTTFLDLEISRVLESRAGEMVHRAVDELLKEAIVERLRERMGARLRELGRAAADRKADDIEANLEIEGRIAVRREQRGKTETSAATRPKAERKPARRGR
jgi:hypothetical protein